MGLAIRNGSVDADGFRIRYQEVGEGPPLVHLHGAYGLNLTPAHDLLSRAFRTIAFEMPGFGTTENQKTQTVQDLATTMAAAAQALGLSRFNLIGTSFGGTVASWIAVQRSDLVAALVLDAPSAIRPEGSEPVSGLPEQIARRLSGPARDTLLEEGLRRLKVPTLVLFGTHDSVTPAGMGRVYKELIADAHLVFVYDAGHALMVERPEAFAEVVTDFLERTDAFIISRTKSVVFP